MNHRKRLADEAERIRQIVAVRSAEQMHIDVNSKALNQKALTNEFQNIDSSADGSLRKDEVKEFFISGKVVSTADSEFNAIFAALDLDGNGGIDFVQFFSFLGQGGKELDDAKKAAWADMIMHEAD